MFKKTLALTALTAGSLALAPAHAQTVTATTTVKAKMLGSVEGQIAIYEQLEKAAKKACRAAWHRNARHTNIVACTKDVLGAMVEDLDHQEITSLHAKGSAYRLAGR